MKLVVRAIVPEADAERHRDEGVVAVRHGGLAALATAREDAPLPNENELRAHDAITTRIHERGPSLPSRFGQVFADEGALASALAERREALAASLESVGDRVEMTITLAWRVPVARATAPEPATGREFLLSRAAREHERRDAQMAVERLVSQLGSERVVTRGICPSDGIAAIVAVLTDRDAVPAVRERVLEFTGHDEVVSAAVHGPVPPYSFAS